MALRRRAERANLILNILDGAFAILAFALLDPGNVIAPFLRKAGASDTLVGLLTSIEPFVRVVVPLLIARRIERLGRKKPTVLLIGVFQRLHAIVVAVMAVFLLPGRRTAFLALYAASLVVYSAANCASGVVWSDFVAKVTPAARRGFLFAWRWNMGIVPIVASSAAIGWLLARLDFPLNYAAILAASGVSFWISFVFVALVRERGGRPAPGGVQDGAGRLGAIAGVLREDPSFARYLVSSSLSALGESMVGAFLVLTAQDRFGVEPERVLAWYMLVQYACFFVGNLVALRLASAKGHRKSLRLRGPLAILACLAALLARDYVQYGLTFAIWGLARSVVSVSEVPIIMEFGGETRRPRYWALWSACFAVATAVGPFAGGVLREYANAEWGFAAAMALSAAGTAVLALTVRDPSARLDGPDPTRRGGP